MTVTQILIFAALNGAMAWGAGTAVEGQRWGLAVCFIASAASAWCVTRWIRRAAEN